MLALMFVVLLRCVQVQAWRTFRVPGKYHRHPGPSPSMLPQVHSASVRCCARCLKGRTAKRYDST